MDAGHVLLGAGRPTTTKVFLPHPTAAVSIGARSAPGRVEWIDPETFNGEAAMIQVREVFRVRFGQAKEAIALAHEGVAIEEKYGGKGSRILADVTGDHYTLVMEQEFESLAAFEEGLQRTFQSPEFRAWYPRFAALIDFGRREIFRIVPAPEASRAGSPMATGAW